MTPPETIPAKAGEREAIKPCPFCGWEGVLPVREPGTRGMAHLILCGGCEATGPAQDDRVGAAVAWNAAPRSAPPAEVVDWNFDMDAAPQDELLNVYAAPRDGLKGFVTSCRWHPDAGFCVDELRYVVAWKRLPAPPARAALHPEASA